MLRVKSIACVIAVLLSSSVSAFDIPLYKQIPNSSFQAVSPQPLVLSNEIVQQEGFLHKSTALAVGNNLIAAYSTNGLSLLRFTDGQYTTLKNYTFAELEADSGSAVRFNLYFSYKTTEKYRLFLLPQMEVLISWQRVKSTAVSSTAMAQRAIATLVLYTAILVIILFLPLLMPVPTVLHQKNCFADRIILVLLSTTKLKIC